jgi:hypothetical protein
MFKKKSDKFKEKMDLKQQAIWRLNIKPLGKKAYVGKAMDLIMLITFSIVGFFLVTMFFLQSDSARSDSILSDVYNWQASDETISILHAPLKLDEQITAPLYLVLASGSKSLTYRTEIEGVFDELYGEGKWAIQIAKTGESQVVGFNEYAWGTLSPANSGQNDRIYQEIIDLENLAGEEIVIKIRNREKR